MLSPRFIPSLIGTICALLLLAACQPQSTSNKDLSELSDTERSLFEQASEMRAAGRLEDAANLYIKVAQMSKGSVEAHVALAEMLRADNRAAQAIPMLEQALRLKPNDARLHMEMGFAQISKASYPDAIRSFDTALSIDDEFGSAYSGKAVALDMQGKHEDAQKIYAEAIARGLSSPSLDSNYALSLIFTGQYDEAIRLLEPHASASTATMVMRQNLALAYGLKGDVGRAKEYGEKDLDPIKAKENLEFYKRYTALKQGISGQPIQIKTNEKLNAASFTEVAVPVSPVLQQDVGFTTGDDASESVVKPEVEVIEVDSAEFEKLTE